MELIQATFDYSIVDEPTADALQARAARIREMRDRALIEIGKELAEAQDELADHAGGIFQKWAIAETGMSRGTIYNLINLYKRFGSHPNFGQLPIPKSALYLLASPSTPDAVVNETIERAQNGESITYTEMKEITERHKEPTYAKVWRLEQAISEWFHSFGDGVSTNARYKTLSALGNGESLYWDTLTRFIDGQHIAWRKRDLIQAINNQLEQLLQGEATIRVGTSQAVEPVEEEATDDEREVVNEWGNGAVGLNRDWSDQELDDYAAANAPMKLEVNDSDEYYTPPYIIEAAQSVLGDIDLDPASCEQAQTVVQATRYFSKADDGLEQRWQGRVWLNPPFSDPKPFVFRAIAEYESGNVTEAIVLTNNGTETEWGQALLSRYPVCFVGYGGPNGSRISFWKNDPNEPRTGNRYAQMIFYLGDDVARFVAVFSRYGAVLIGVTREPEE